VSFAFYLLLFTFLKGFDMTTLILGLGNPILSDDSVGICVAEAVRAEIGGQPLCDVTACSVGGLSLMEALLGYERAILIDAFQSNDTPGVFHRLTLDDLRALRQTEHSVSPHDTSLSTAVDLGRSMGLPLPDEIVIYAVEAANVSDFGERLTPAVADAIPKVTRAVLSEIQL
jgi:hydrogenase maturation protease